MILREGSIDRRSKIHRCGPFRPRRRHERGPVEAQDRLLRLWCVASNQKNEHYEGSNDLAHAASLERAVTRQTDAWRVILSPPLRGLLGQMAPRGLPPVCGETARAT